MTTQGSEPTIHASWPGAMLAKSPVLSAPLHPAGLTLDVDVDVTASGMTLASARLGEGYEDLVTQCDFFTGLLPYWGRL